MQSRKQSALELLSQKTLQCKMVSIIIFFVELKSLEEIKCIHYQYTLGLFLFYRVVVSLLKRDTKIHGSKPITSQVLEEARSKMRSQSRTSVAKASTPKLNFVQSHCIVFSPRMKLENPFSINIFPTVQIHESF